MIRLHVAVLVACLLALLRLGAGVEFEIPTISDFAFDPFTTNLTRAMIELVRAAPFVVRLLTHAFAPWHRPPRT